MKKSPNRQRFGLFAVWLLGEVQILQLYTLSVLHLLSWWWIGASPKCRGRPPRPCLMPRVFIKIFP